MSNNNEVGSDLSFLIFEVEGGLLGFFLLSLRFNTHFISQLQRKEYLAFVTSGVLLIFFIYSFNMVAEVQKTSEGWIVITPVLLLNIFVYAEKRNNDGIFKREVLGVSTWIYIMSTQVVSLLTFFLITISFVYITESTPNLVWKLSSAIHFLLVINTLSLTQVSKLKQACIVVLRCLFPFAFIITRRIIIPVLMMLNFFKFLLISFDAEGLENIMWLFIYCLLHISYLFLTVLLANNHESFVISVILATPYLSFYPSLQEFIVGLYLNKVSPEKVVWLANKIARLATCICIVVSVIYIV